MCRGMLWIYLIMVISLLPCRALRDSLGFSLARIYYESVDTPNSVATSNFSLILVYSQPLAVCHTHHLIVPTSLGSSTSAAGQQTWAVTLELLLCPHCKMAEGLRLSFLIGPKKPTIFSFFMVFAFVVKRGLVTSRLFSCWR